MATRERALLSDLATSRTEQASPTWILVLDYLGYLDDQPAAWHIVSLLPIYFALASADLNLSATNCRTVHFVTMTQQNTYSGQLHMTVCNIVRNSSYKRDQNEILVAFCASPLSVCFTGAMQTIEICSSYLSDAELFPFAFLHPVTMQDLYCDWLKWFPEGRMIWAISSLILPTGPYDITHIN